VKYLRHGFEAADKWSVSEWWGRGNVATRRKISGRGFNSKFAPNYAFMFYMFDDQFTLQPVPVAALSKA
jgi:hypothetical protein